VCLPVIRIRKFNLENITTQEYLKSCARIFFKRDGPGSFAKYHNRLLELNSWDSTPQEILVSTPRRFGKTISVSMFAAAMMFSCPNLELSIYSTCKRISQKLLRNIVRFLDIIYLELNVPKHKVLRMNSEEVHVQGNEGQGDTRIINSYPSKIGKDMARPIKPRALSETCTIGKETARELAESSSR